MTENGRPEVQAEPTAGAEADVSERLALSIEEALRIRGAADPQSLADALEPAVGRAMRRAVFGIFKSLVRAVNRVVLYTATWRGIKWRAESMWTGRPFAQVVESHTVVRPVQQVLLIHRRTGLLLCQAQKGGVDSQDGDMVSGMLTAIQDFVDDSFQSGKPGQLATVRFGDLNLCIEQGGPVVLAGILDGEVTMQFRQAFRRTLSRILNDFGPALNAFDGDTGPLEDVRPYLDACLRTQQPMAEHILPGTWLLIAAPIVAVLVWGGFAVRNWTVWRGVIEQIETMPGIVLLDHGYRSGRFYLVGLRDPLSVDPGIVIEDSVLKDRVAARWEPYNSVAQEIVLRRARSMLDPPSSIGLTLENGRLKARGTASAEWIDRAQIVSKGLCGVQGIDVDEVVSVGDVETRRWDRAVEQVAAGAGIVVLDHGRRHDRYFIHGLRDPMAADPGLLLAGLGFPADTVTSAWELYETTEPTFVLGRVRRILEPPNEVTMGFQDGVLKATGAAPHEWVRKAELLARTVRGVSRFDTVHLIDREVEAFDALRDRLEALTFRVFSGSGDLLPGQARRMDAFVENVRQLSMVSRRLDRGFTIEIRGHMPTSGAEDTDAAVSLGLARRFLELLWRRTVDPSVFATRGMGAEPPVDNGGESQALREALISFRVVL